MRLSMSQDKITLTFALPRVLPNTITKSRIEQHIKDLQKLRSLFDAYGAWGKGLVVNGQIEQLKELLAICEKNSDGALKKHLRGKLAQTSIVSVLGQLYADIQSVAEGGEPLFASVFEIPDSIAAERKRRSDAIRVREEGEARRRQEAVAEELEVKKAEEQRQKIAELGLTDIVARMRETG